MTREEVARPGRVLWTLARCFCTSRFRDTVVQPTLADMQHEYAEAHGRSWWKAWVRVRAVGSLLGACGLYVAHMPARHFREIWLAAHAPGPRLLRGMLPTAGLVVVAGALVLYVNEHRPRFPYLLAPGYVLVLGPTAIAMGVTRAIGRGARSNAPKQSGAELRAALSIAGAATLGLTVVSLVLLPIASQSWRERVAGHTVLWQGANEMTLAELNQAIGHDEEGRGVRLTVARHVRFAIPAACLSLTVLGLALVRTARPWVGLVMLWVVGTGGFFGALRFGMLAGHSGLLSPLLSVWASHLVVWTCAGIAFFASPAFRSRVPEQ